MSLAHSQPVSLIGTPPFGSSSPHDTYPVLAGGAPTLRYGSSPRPLPAVPGLGLLAPASAGSLLKFGLGFAGSPYGEAARCGGACATPP